MIKIIIKNLDIQLIYIFVLSIFNYIYNKFLIFLIINIPDDYLIYNNNSIPYIVDNYFSDSDSDSDDELNNTKCYKSKQIDNLETLNKFLKLWEYEVILKIFNIPGVDLSRITEFDKQRIPILFNSNYNNNNYINDQDIDLITFSESFLFNISLNKKDLNLFIHDNKDNKYE